MLKFLGAFVDLPEADARVVADQKSFPIQV
jgi:hypothetical protein